MSSHRTREIHILGSQPLDPEILGAHTARRPLTALGPKSSSVSCDRSHGFCHVGYPIIPWCPHLLVLICPIDWLQCEAPKIAKLVQITPITMVYGTYNYSYWGESKPTNITGGPHIVEFWNSMRYQQRVPRPGLVLVGLKTSSPRGAPTNTEPGNQPRL